MKEQKMRQSNLELLRIICMLMIVIDHCVWHSGLLDIENNNRYISYFLMQGGQIGVNCFILISGYFLINSKFKIKKIFEMIKETDFYSIIIMGGELLLSYKMLNLKSILKSFFPIVLGQYWFISIYVVLYLLHPYINKMLNIKKEQHILLIVILTIILCIIPTFTFSKFFDNEILWFMYMYILGAYIRKYGLFQNFNKKNIYLLIFILTYFLIFILTIILSKLSGNFAVILGKERFFSGRQTITILICSVSLFMYFINLKIKNNRLINSISSTTFGIYLIHEHPIISNILWTKVFNILSLRCSSLLFGYIIMCSILVFITCSLIDYARQNINKRININKNFKALDQIDFIVNDY